MSGEAKGLGDKLMGPLGLIEIDFLILIVTFSLGFGNFWDLRISAL
jgi:hypothetical protein